MAICRKRKSQQAKTSGASTFMDPDDISFDEEERLSMSQGMSAFCIMGRFAAIQRKLRCFRPKSEQRFILKKLLEIASD